MFKICNIIATRYGYGQCKIKRTNKVIVKKEENNIFSEINEYFVSIIEIFE